SWWGRPSRPAPSTTTPSTTRCTARSKRARRRATRPRPSRTTSGSPGAAPTTRGCRRAGADEADGAHAAGADVPFVDLDEVVGAATDRTAGIDATDLDLAVLEPEVEEVARPDRERAAQLGRDDHAAEVVDLSGGTDPRHGSTNTQRAGARRC